MTIKPPTTPMLPNWLSLQERQTKDYYHFRLWVQPGAKNTQLMGIVFDTHHWVIKLRLAAPPVDGKANLALIHWLAKQLNCPKKCIEIASGALNRHKSVLVQANAVELSHLLAVFS